MILFYLYVPAHINAGACGDKGVLDTLELE